MQRFIGIVALGATLSFAPAMAAAPPHHPRLAPADEYFGPFKISILGIHNMIHDAGARFDADPTKANATFGTAVQAEVALKEWERRYPEDTLIPRNIYFLERLYTKLRVLPEAQKKTIDTRDWLLGKYGKSPQARVLRAQLASDGPPPTPMPMPTPGQNFVPSPGPMAPGPGAPASPAPKHP
jgi:hypothetical protein